MRHINVQMQTGASDCGLFTLAFATALCAGKVEKGELIDFPASKKPRHCTNTVKCIKSVVVYCICRFKAVDLYGYLVQCGNCKEWFHQKCMDIPTAVFVEQSYMWFVHLVHSVSLLHLSNI